VVAAGATYAAPQAPYSYNIVHIPLIGEPLPDRNPGALGKGTITFSSYSAQQGEWVLDNGVGTNGSLGPR
jgi:hypothetical protein